MSIPRRLIVEFDDGSQKEIEFSSVSGQAQESLAALGLCPPPATASKSYLLLRWQNGWQEIVGLDKTQVELLRYYTIERKEEIGRMSFETGETYPVLLFVKRLPKEVESALLTNSTGSAVYYAFAEQTTIAEGGKTEHILYDKKDLKLTVGYNGKADLWILELINSVKAELDKNGLTAEKLLSMGSDQKATVYGSISKALSICAMERQEDVHGFIELMLRKVKG
jgi:hypothetical protein